MEIRVLREMGTKATFVTNRSFLSSKALRLLLGHFSCYCLYSGAEGNRVKDFAKRVHLLQRTKKNSKRKREVKDADKQLFTNRLSMNTVIYIIIFLNPSRILGVLEEKLLNTRLFHI